MGENTKIEWAHHTWNPWIGCSKVSAGCKYCYAEEMMDKRYGRAKWGDATRVRTSEAYWKKPLSWNRQAEKTGTRLRVFPSLCDPFEDRPELAPWRADFWDVILKTPHIDWLLLTKRPENVRYMMPPPYRDELVLPNVWIGTSVENQEQADKRIPELLKVPAAVRFLSCEPLLGPVDIRRWGPECYECGLSCGLRLPEPPEFERCVECGDYCGPTTEPIFSDGCPKCSGELEFVCPDCDHYMVHQHEDTPCIDWVICGGESGRNARPIHPDWARGLRDQCQASGVPFLFKQWGEWIPKNQTTAQPNRSTWGVMDSSGNYYDKTTAWNGNTGSDSEAGEEYLYRVGKHAAGRQLDGRTWDEFPEIEATK